MNAPSVFVRKEAVVLVTALYRMMYAGMGCHSLDSNTQKQKEQQKEEGGEGDGEDVVFKAFLANLSRCQVQLVDVYLHRSQVAA